MAEQGQKENWWPEPMSMVAAVTSRSWWGYRMLIGSLAVAWLSWPADAGSLPEIEGIWVGLDGRRTRVVVDVDQAVAFSATAETVSSTARSRPAGSRVAAVGRPDIASAWFCRCLPSQCAEARPGPPDRGCAGEVPDRPPVRAGAINRSAAPLTCLRHRGARSACRGIQLGRAGVQALRAATWHRAAGSCAAPRATVKTLTLRMANNHSGHKELLNNPTSGRPMYCRVRHSEPAKKHNPGCSSSPTNASVTALKGSWLAASSIRRIWSSNMLDVEQYDFITPR